MSEKRGYAVENEQSVLDPSSDQIDLTWEVISRFQRFGWDIAGVFALAVAAMTLLGLFLPEFSKGFLLIWWIGFAEVWFGWGSLWLVLIATVLGIGAFRHRHLRSLKQIRWGRIFALEFAALASLALLAVWGNTSLERADAGLDGGRIGWALAYILQQVVGTMGLSGIMWQVIFISMIILVCLIFGLGLHTSLAGWVERQAELAAENRGTVLTGESPVSVAPIPDQEAIVLPVNQAKRKKSRRLPAEFRKSFRVQSEESQTDSPPHERDERLPALDLLVSEKASRPDERNINLTAGLIEKTLAEFGIPAKVVGFKVGPTVTQFAVEPGFVEKGANDDEGEAARHKVRVAQISSLKRDLALALSAERLRIQAPVPGRPYIGVEVPNAHSTVVRLRPILETDIFYRINSTLAIALGRDVSGQPVVADLGSMPHLLIAGTTGSGKSVCIAALTSCLVMNNTPAELRIIMVDPKMVELVRFNGLPHLYGKVETDIERILGVLRWTVAEMDRRYKLLETSRSRNLDSYNRKARRRKGEDPLPRIVLLIDELADLMISTPEQTEPALVRLAQMARATGIHLVVATQRPSTDVVTGLIKANFPARLSFAVASSIDSRVILDSTGAESLLGKGDMLFLPPEAPAPLRAQGVMVSDSEVENVITYWQNTIGISDEEKPPWDEMLEKEAILADRDDLVEQALELVRETQRASASLLQRRLRIGYPRAARLIDELEDLGIVGPSQGSGRERDVLIGPEDDED